MSCPFTFLLSTHTLFSSYFQLNAHIARLQESPRFLASTNKRAEAIENLAYLRRRAVDDHEVVKEMAEIEATVEEERVAREVSIIRVFSSV